MDESPGSEKRSEICRVGFAKAKTSRQMSEVKNDRRCERNESEVSEAILDCTGGNRKDTAKINCY
jgi:hypothetical protein